jgi:hypothetical protein
VEKFTDQVGRPYTQKKHKNCWDALKGLYDYWLSLAHTTGIGWDSKLNTYTASYEFWDNNTKVMQVMSFYMCLFFTKVDDVISTNSVTSKAVQGDFMKDEISEAMKLARESRATKESDEHYIATRLFVKSKNRDVFMTLETNEGCLN